MPTLKTSQGPLTAPTLVPAPLTSRASSILSTTRAMELECLLSSVILPQTSPDHLPPFLHQMRWPILERRSGRSHHSQELESSLHSLDKDPAQGSLVQAWEGWSMIPGRSSLCTRSLVQCSHQSDLLLNPQGPFHHQQRLCPMSMICSSSSKMMFWMSTLCPRWPAQQPAPD